MSKLTAKRKSKSSNQQNPSLPAAIIPKPLLSHSVKAKTSGATKSMETFLGHLSTYEKDSDPTKASVMEMLQTSPILVQTMLRCQERFVKVVATELSVSSKTVNSATKVYRVGEPNIQIAMQGLGMQDIFSEAIRIQRNVVDVDSIGGLSNKRKRKTERRVKQWSEEEISEQERLLACSKEKMLRGGD
jgi:hypothetical protein